MSQFSQRRNGRDKPPAAIRCAVYTRKSTDEGLDQEFNSLDAQRESGEAYILSQAQEGWELVADHYDDGGFTGGNMDRPALKRMMADIEAGRIDCVVVYKVDRLSRSLMDFSRMLEKFDRHSVSFVAVTQNFNTTSSMGRLTLNILLSFAQFEREIISERTRDKIAAARRKGKWSGGMPLLGYDVDPRGSKLIVNEDEAVRVRTIYELYLEHRSLLAVIQELENRGWLNKRWVTRKGTERGGKTFTKSSLHKLLTNVTYVGKLRYKDEVHEGEHAGIVDPETWRRVQSLLQRNGRTGGALVRNRFGALLKGLLRCVPCDATMVPTHTKKPDGKRYRYYVCSAAQKRGWHTCPSRSIPATEIERFVVDQIRCVGRDEELIRDTVTQARQQADELVQGLEAERHGLEQELVRWNDEVRRLIDQLNPSEQASPAVDRLADLQERIRDGERRMTELREKALALSHKVVDQKEVAQAMSLFDPLWESMPPREQVRVISLLVSRVDYDGARNKVAVTFHPNGIQTLTEEFTDEDEAS